ncbi:MAG: hypothetical protein JSU08_15495 [Acidobacteria bacterium]|nr:hypothetical protein [Acidobacteriota bacterium]
MTLILAATVTVRAQSGPPPSAQVERYKVETRGTTPSPATPQETPFRAPAPELRIVAPARTANSLLYYDFLYSDAVPSSTRRALAPKYEDYYRTLQEIEANRVLDLWNNVFELAGMGAVKSRVRPGMARDPRVTIDTEHEAGPPPDAEPRERLARLADLRDEIERLESEHGIPPDNSPLRTRNVVRQVDSSTLDRWMREAAESAARAIAADNYQTTLTASEQLDMQAKAKVNSERRHRDVEDARGRLDRAQRDHAQGRDERADAERAKQEAVRRQSSPTIPPDILKAAVPPDWVPCTCPDRHPNAGLFINNQRWHTASLSCSVRY